MVIQGSLNNSLFFNPCLKYNTKAFLKDKLLVSIFLCYIYFKKPIWAPSLMEPIEENSKYMLGRFK